MWLFTIEPFFRVCMRTCVVFDASATKAASNNTATSALSIGVTVSAPWGSGFY